MLVYEAFEKLGWLYVPFKPEPPGPHPTIRESIYILTKKLAASHNDNEQELFRAMKNIQGRSQCNIFLCAETR